jgi:hypothetical protein
LRPVSRQPSTSSSARQATVVSASRSVRAASSAQASVAGFDGGAPTAAPASATEENHGAGSSA